VRKNALSNWLKYSTNEEVENRLGDLENGALSQRVIAHLYGGDAASAMKECIDENELNLATLVS
jgi:hypothetical protein